MSEQSTELKPVNTNNTGIANNLPTVEEVQLFLDHVDKIKKGIIRQEDVVAIGDKLHIKKSGCIRYAMGLGLSIEIVKTECKKDADGLWLAIVTARAIGGRRFVEATAACYEMEKWVKEPKLDKDGNEIWEDGKKVCTDTKIPPSNPQQIPHNVTAHAETRASNRAILKFLGKGDVSAEEMGGLTSDNYTPPKAPRESPTTEQMDELEKYGYTGGVPESKRGAELILADLRKGAKA